jgi:hypothetical protein
MRSHSHSLARKKRDTRARTPVPLQYFYYFLTFNLCFFALQFALLCAQKGNFVSLIILPMHVYLEWAATLAIHLSLYALVSLMQTFFLLGLFKRLGRDDFAGGFIIIGLASICFLLSANAYYFPLSLLGKLVVFLTAFNCVVTQ